MGDTYVLDRSETESARNIGYLLHPSIIEKLDKHSCAIADVGTGTGIFLIELAEELPSSSSLDGFDISDEAYPPPLASSSLPPPSSSHDGINGSSSGSKKSFPPRRTLPANVKLSVHDAKTPFPQALRGGYDVVHLKLMVSGLGSEAEWRTVCANVIDLLKPGGALQWTEADHLSASFHYSHDCDDDRHHHEHHHHQHQHQHHRQGHSVGVDPTMHDDGPETDNAGSSSSGVIPATATGNASNVSSSIPSTLQQVGECFKDASRHRMQHGHSTLSRIFREKGLENVSQHIVPSDRVPDTREEFTKMGFAGIFGWQRQLQLKNAPGAWTPARTEELKRRCDEEISNGAYYRVDIYITTGWKPKE